MTAPMRERIVELIDEYCGNPEFCADRIISDIIAPMEQEIAELREALRSDERTRPVPELVEQQVVLQSALKRREDRTAREREKVEKLRGVLAAEREKITRLEQAAQPFIAVLEYQERSHRDGYRPPIDEDEYISVHSHITEKHFRALRRSLDETGGRDE